MKNALGWLDTRLAQITLTTLSIACVTLKRNNLNYFSIALPRGPLNNSVLWLLYIYIYIQFSTNHTHMCIYIYIYIHTQCWFTTVLHYRSVWAGRPSERVPKRFHGLWQLRVALLGWHYLSNATCFIRRPLFMRVSSCQGSP